MLGKGRRPHESTQGRIHLQSAAIPKRSANFERESTCQFFSSLHKTHAHGGDYGSSIRRSFAGPTASGPAGGAHRRVDVAGKRVVHDRMNTFGCRGDERAGIAAGGKKTAVNEEEVGYVHAKNNIILNLKSYMI